MKKFDVIIIGAGIIGLSTAYQIQTVNPSIKICILEKENEIAKHQSGHNSGVIHSGIYYKPGSLKAINCLKGYQMLLRFCDENKIPYEICGKIIIASEETEFPKLKNLYERGAKNGLKGIELISSEEIKKIEPYAQGLQGLFIPQTGIIDYKIVSKKISELIVNKGAEIKFNEMVTDINMNGTATIIKTTKTNYSSSITISCAGLYSDKIANMMKLNNYYKIIPFRGEYYYIRNSRKYLVRNLIYPVPNSVFPFLGLHFTRRIDNSVEAGPNAVLAFKKEGYRKSDFKFKDAIDTLSYSGFHKIFFKYWKTGVYELYRSLRKKEFVSSLQKIIPEVKEDDLIPGNTGVRAQACDRKGNLIDDFLFLEDKRVINVFNAPSPAATSCFSIGETIAEKILKYF